MSTAEHLLARHQHNLLFIQSCLRNVRTWQVCGWCLLAFNTTTNRRNAGRGRRIFHRFQQRIQDLVVNEQICALRPRRTARGWLDRAKRERLLQSSGETDNAQVESLVKEDGCRDACYCDESR